MAFRDSNRRMTVDTTAKSSSANPNDLFSKIQKRAYELYVKRGSSKGNSLSDWLEAERQIKKEFGIR